MNLFLPPVIYIYFLIFGTIISISSSSIFGVWLGLEINLMSFIPMIINLDQNKKSSEAAVKYFLVQTMASAIILLSSLMFILFPSNTLSFIPSIMITLSLSMKLGMAPFHFWFPETMEGLNWINSMILLTWQKISPLIIMSMLFNPSTLILLSLTSALTGAVSGLNQTSLRKILSFSSISHLGWMNSIMYMNNEVWLTYFLIYSIMSIILCTSFFTLSLNYFSQLIHLNNTSKKIMIFINLLSMGGMPPMLGFLPKWAAILTLSKNSPILMTLIISSLITLYFYTRLCFSAFTLYNPEFLWNHKESNKKMTLLSIMTLISILSLSPLMYLFL
uniref:NADH-ubiquinone oxidoreductase chain 2 n=1 Tax=Vulcanolepas fijiensis TaxID=2511776 RepID=A0A649YDS2_9CRUS|nr:NADH dehydrogenase subunit 2 [Vulcanolepas fijiensis]QGL53220.1 NADH dehydrogenase subunit 2 [Vulcanolepas fijiensis]